MNSMQQENIKLAWREMQETQIAKYFIINKHRCIQRVAVTIPKGSSIHDPARFKNQITIQHQMFSILCLILCLINLAIIHLNLTKNNFIKSHTLIFPNETDLNNAINNTPLHTHIFLQKG